MYFLMRLMTYPTFEEIIARKGDRELFRTYRSYSSLIPLILLFLFFLIMSLILTNLSANPFGLWMQNALGISSRWFSLPAAVVLLEIIRRRNNDAYVLGREMLSHYGGRISLKYYIHIIKYKDIRAVNVLQSFSGRMLNYGTLEVSTAAQKEGDVYFYGVSSPIELAGIIDKFRSENQSRHSGEDPATDIKNDGE